MEENNTTETTTPASSSNKTTVIVLIAIVLVAGLGWMALSGNKNSNPSSTNTQNSTTTQVTPTQATVDSNKSSASESAMMEQTLTVSGQNFSFTPTQLKVKKGQKVKLTFTSSGGMHDFVIDELNVKTNVIGSGKSETVEFTPTKAGTFEYYCSVGKHREMGMKGTLVVE